MLLMLLAGACWLAACRSSRAAVLLPLPYLYDTTPWLKYRTKFVVYYLWLTAMSFVMIPVSLLRPGRVDNARVGALLMVPLSPLLGLEWVVEGEVGLLARDEAAVIVANHQSSIDLLGMFVIWGQLRRVAALAKQSLLYTGTFGITAALCGTVFVDRADKEGAAAKLNSASLTLKEERTKLWIFPEGTRNGARRVDMLPFKKGAFHVAVASNLPILPIVISRHEFLDSSAKVFDSGRGVMTVLPLIWPAGRTVEQLAEVTREAMLRQYRRAGGHMEEGEDREDREDEVDVREIDEVEVRELEEVEVRELEGLEVREVLLQHRSTGAGQTP